MYCPSCHGEYREGFDWCQDCDVALVEALPEEPPEDALEDDDAEETDELEQASAAPDTDRQESDLRVLELGLVLTVAFLVPLTSSIYAWWNHLSVERLDGSFAPFLFKSTFELGPLLVLVYVLARQGRSLRDIGLNLPLRGSDLLFGFALSIWQLLPGLFSFLGKGESTAWWIAAHFTTSTLTPFLFLRFLVGATFEELIVRAFMMTEVIELTGSAFLAIASSVCLQSLYHIDRGGPGVLGHTLNFLVSALFYWKTRRIAPVILGHFGHNILVSMVIR